MNLVLLVFVMSGWFVLIRTFQNFLSNETLAIEGIKRIQG